MHSFHIYRYIPDLRDAPRMQVFELEVDPGDRMLLDVLTRLKAIDPSLSYRRSCREGICGSDAMNINGKNGLACITNMRALPAKVVLKPLPGLLVIRDLIVDMTPCFRPAGSWWTAATRPRPNALTTWKTRTVFSAAEAS